MCSSDLIPIAAVALGAKVIEKHFTVDRTLPGPDHRASLEPNQLREMVTAIRNIEVAVGNGIKRPTDSESKNRIAVRKSIVAVRVIQSGELFDESNLTCKRPGDGVSPMFWDKYIGKRANRMYEKDELIDPL